MISLVIMRKRIKLFYNIEVKDSLFNETSSAKIAGLQTKNESKGQRNCLFCRTRKKLKNFEIGKETMLRDSLIAGLVVIIIIAFLINNRYRIKKKANSLLEEKITMINEQKEELKLLNNNKDKLLSIIRMICEVHCRLCLVIPK